MTETSVIIPCWIIDKTLLKFTERCVQSIRDTSDVELILVDNGSILGSEFLKSEADIYIRNQTNLGYTKAMNQGIVASSSDYIVCGANDFQMTKGWVKALREPLDEIDYCGIMCPHSKGNPKHETLWQEHGTPGGWYMIKKSTIEKIGLLDERFFNTFSDFDLVFRMKKLGLWVISTPFITVTHYGEASLIKDIGRHEEHRKSMRLLIDKWGEDKDFKEFLREINRESTQSL